jgi:hypothetical protein
MKISVYTRQAPRLDADFSEWLGFVWQKCVSFP